MTEQEAKNITELPALQERPVRTGRRRMSVLRRPEEDVPGSDYLERMTALGPRQGESMVAFRCRIASTAEGRRVWIESATKYSGDLTQIAAELGVSKTNIRFYLRQVGLTLNDLRR